MYEDIVEGLCSRREGKRRKAAERIMIEFKKDPCGVVESLLNLPDKCWQYAYEIFMKDKKTSARCLVRFLSNKRAREALKKLGYDPQKIEEKIKRIKSKISLIKNEGWNADEVESLLRRGMLSASEQKADEIISRINKSKSISENLKEVKDYLDSKGIVFEPYEELLSLGKKNPEKAESLVEDVYDIVRCEDYLNYLQNYVDVSHLRKRLDSSRTYGEVVEAKDKIKDMYKKIKEILQVYEDRDIVNLLRNGKIEDAEKLAKIKRKIYDAGKTLSDKTMEEFLVVPLDSILNIHEVISGNHAYVGVVSRKSISVYDETGVKIYEKKFSTVINSSHAFRYKDGACFLIGTDGCDIHAYDEKGRELFYTKMEASINVVRGTFCKKPYLVGCDWNRVLRFYDIYGNKIFEKAYGDVVQDVAIHCGEKVYIVAAGSDKKVHVYDEYGHVIFEKNFSNPIMNVFAFKDRIILREFDRTLHTYDFSGRELFSEKYKGVISTIYASDIGKGYICVGIGSGVNEFLIYDLDMKLVFQKKFSSPVTAVHIFKSGEKIYFVIGNAEGELHIYDEEGDVVFFKSLGERISKVRAFYFGNRLYIFVGVVGEEEVKLITYASIPIGDALKWAEELSLNIDYLSLFTGEEDEEEFSNKIKELFYIINEKKNEYQSLLEKWNKLRKILTRVGVKIEERPKDYDKLEEAIHKLEQKLKEYYPKINVEILGFIKPGKWSDVNIEVKNIGKTEARNITFRTLSDDVLVDGLDTIDKLKPGEKKSLRGRVKCDREGRIEVFFSYRYYNPLTEKEEEDFVTACISAGRAGVKKFMHIVDAVKGIVEFGNIEKYEVLEQIGAGGFSKVYKVELDGVKYAMKVPLDADLEKGVLLSTTLTEDDLNKFKREVIIWGVVSRYFPKNTVKLIDAGIEPFPWFVMELCDYSLRSIMNKISLEEKIKIMIDILELLHRIHRMGFIHRDIKPENILFKEGVPKLTDFGAGRIVWKATVSGGNFMGTVMYAAPEQFSRAEDYRTDIYQAGAMLYELITGRGPFEAEDVMGLIGKIINEKPEPPSKYVNIPAELDAVVLKALEKDKGRRWRNAKEFADALRQVLLKL